MNLSRLLALSLVLSPLFPARADEAATRTDQAFGQRIGVEQIGLYTEGQARGFDLSTANAYRIEDAYFARAGNMSDTVVDNVAVQLGVSAARSALPSPTGVVNYSLKHADADRTRITTGWRENASPFVEGEVRRRIDDGQHELVADALLQPNLTYADGTRGWNGELGLVLREHPEPGTQVTLFGTFDDSRSGGPYEIVPTAGLPDEVHHHGSLGAPYAQFAATIANAGILLRWRAGEILQVDASLLHSDYRQTRFDDTLLFASPQGSFAATLLRQPETGSRADSGQLAAHWASPAGPVVQRFGLGIRVRHTRSSTVPGEAFSLGVVDAEHPVYPLEPYFSAGAARLGDSVDQNAVFGDYAVALNERLEARIGLSMIRQDHRVSDLQGLTVLERSTARAPSAALVWLFAPGWTLFGDVVRGLEDSGAAPQNAANRDQPLPPVEARQVEIGISHSDQQGQGVNFNLFDIAKPVAGFDDQQVYRLLPAAHHRGGEISCAMGSAEHASLLAGVTLLQARLADGGTRPGISERIAFAQVKIRAGAHFVLDAVLSWQSGAAIDPRASVRTSPLRTADLGLRYNFRLEGRPAELRASLVNVFDARMWQANGAGTLYRPQPQSLRLALSVDLDERQN
jgi:iron complex outermembrane receptor protein